VTDTANKQLHTRTSTKMNLTQNRRMPTIMQTHTVARPKH